MKPNRTQARTRRWVATVGLLALLLPATAWAGKKKENGEPKNINLVWPVPPDKPRIKYVGAIYGAGDVEPAKKAGFLDRLAGIEKNDIKPGFVKPYGIATDSKGRIYVTDSGQGLVFVLDTKSKKVSYLGRTPQLRLMVPIGITVDSKDRVWVADPVGQHVVAFDGEGNVVMTLGRTGELVNPTDVVLDEARQRAYVVDSKQHKVVVYNPETGALIGQFGKRGDQPGEFNFPTNIALDRQGRIYVTDTMNCRVQIFTPEYSLVETLGQQGMKRGDFLKPKGIALDSYGNLYVVDSDFDNFQVFDQKNRLLMFLGSGGQVPGTFWLPAGIYIDRNNTIYVADQSNQRIQIFQLLNGETEEPKPTPVATAPARPADTKGGDPGKSNELKGPASSQSNEITKENSPR